MLCKYLAIKPDNTNLLRILDPVLKLSMSRQQTMPDPGSMLPTLWQDFDKTDQIKMDAKITFEKTSKY